MVSNADKRIALNFIHEYAKTHWRFDGGQILEAWRAIPTEKAAHEYWRNTWAALMAQGARNGWYIAVDRVKPQSKQSHTRTLTLWQSCLCKAPVGATGGDTASAFIGEQVSLLRMGKITAHQLAWRVYAFGKEDYSNLIQIPEG